MNRLFHKSNSRGSLLSPGGFTLIELLVVLSIVTLLIAILLPALHKARERATDVRCLSNLKQYGICVLTYAEDNKGIMANAGTELVGAVTQVRPFNRILIKGNYINRNITVCPSFTPESYIGTSVGNWNTYGVNYKTVPSSTNEYESNVPGTISLYTNMYLIRSPAAYFTVGDTVDTGAIKTQFSYMYFNHSKKGLHLRHGVDQAQVLFADGHCTANGKDDLKTNYFVETQSSNFMFVYDRKFNQITILP
ncbi:MAG: prepilin-type N-terminal cleavage/methylation domain-containing protein [Phycisphaeraceae bacterium]|nr:prepilin-type N-terminal cleavage/methylation domain-containing protein [Phycisphaeraceae bacterium]